MNEKELIRRALMGDEQAQEECTEKEIMLPCPFCGEGARLTTEKELCAITCEYGSCIGGNIRPRYEKLICAISDWNTRPAPPIGRCGECKHFTSFFNELGYCKILSQEKDLGGDGYHVEMLKTDFCSYFESWEE